MFDVIEEIVGPNGEVKSIRGPSLEFIRAFREKQLEESVLEFVEGTYYCIHLNVSYEADELVVLARVNFTHKGKLTESVIDEYIAEGRLWVPPMTHLSSD